MVRKLFYTFVLLSAFSQIKAQVIDSCNTQIQIQIELVIKNVLPLDSLCSYISDENNRITLIFCFDDNFNIDKVEIHTKASFNALHISSFQEELKKMKIDNICIENLKEIRKYNKEANLRFIFKPKI
ncbi:MAG TPA: hypothetical protein DD396_08410 [Bacteroidetes bacterium]|jgi:hypothetical protein|nr:hypothetical protein [Bacteroidota bacterium]